MGAWILATALSAQKPAIDLITSNQQYKHPEAIIDTGYYVNPPVADSLLVQPRLTPKQDQKGKAKKKRHRQIGPSLDSLFQNRKAADRPKKESPEKITSYRKKYNPLNIYLHIIALK